MGISTQKQKTTSSQKTSENATTTPIVQPWIEDALRGYMGDIQAFGQLDPSSLVAGPSELQQLAFAKAGDLGAWKAPAAEAAGLARSVAALGPNLASATGYQAATGQGQGYQAPKLGPAALADWKSYQSPTLGGPSLATATGYTASEATPAQIAAIREASARRGSDFMKDYLNPYTQQVVDTTLADYDANSGTVRAKQAAQMAANRAFGGSRMAIQSAQTEGELARGRASTAANLRSNAFNTAAGLGMQDADRFTTTDVFNAGQFNNRNIEQARLGTQVNLRNADARDTAASFTASAGNRASEVNSGYNNQFALTRAQMEEAAARHAADTYNTGTRANTDTRNQFTLTQGGMDENAARFGAEAANTFGLANLSAQNRASEFGANAMNRLSEFNATQGDAAAGRQLQAAGLLGDLGNSAASNERADLQALAALGLQQREIEQIMALAPVQRMQILSQLYASFPSNMFTGQNISSTGSSSGTGTTTTSPGLGAILLQLGQNATSAYTAGK